MGKTDNASNKRIGRVGMPIGSMPQSSSGSNANVNADNAENPLFNRVGLTHGTAPVSNQRPQLNEASPQARRASPEIRPAEHRSQTRSTSRQCKENERSRKVDKDQNRSRNRVGLPYGTPADSIRDLDPSDADCSQPRNDASGKQNGNIKDEDHETCRYDRATGKKDTRKTNARLPHKDAVVKRNDAKHQATDNMTRKSSPQIPSAENRSKTRSTSDQQSGENERSGKVNVDSAQNSRINRVDVGLPYGTTADSVRDLDRSDADCSQPRNDASGRNHCEDVVYNTKERPHTGTTKVYADNPQNRKLDRVGLPLGSKVYSSKTKEITTRTYANNPINRKLGRVGKPLGSMPRRSFITDKINIFMDKRDQEKSDCLDQTKIFAEAEHERYLDDSGVLDDMLSSRDTSKDVMQQIICHQNRQLVENSWKQANQSTNGPKTDMSFLNEYKGKKIDFNELKLHSVIGKGGFGEVYYAKWKETVVAAKIIRSERVSEKALTNFGEEVMKFCEMDHPNIVTFIGACTKRPNVCIVMEYMQFSLYDALHVRQIQFPDEIKLNIIQQICKGMKYLHERRIAHCDLKSANILMDYVENRVCNVKITDFGLSMIRSHFNNISVPRRH